MGDAGGALAAAAVVVGAVVGGAVGAAVAGAAVVGGAVGGGGGAAVVGGSCGRAVEAARRWSGERWAVEVAPPSWAEVAAEGAGAQARPLQRRRIGAW